MTSQGNWPVAIIGTGNIGTDLMIKILRSDGTLTLGAMVVPRVSDGLAVLGSSQTAHRVNSAPGL
jgi:acetaldehyde dehydrogenase